MRRFVGRNLAYSLAVSAGLMFGGLAEPAVGQEWFSTTDITRLVEGLKNGTLSPAYVSSECERDVVQGPEGENLRQVISTYLEVPEPLAQGAFCRALVQAIRDGELTTEGLVKVARQKIDADTFLEVGRILRAVYFAHRRTTTASLEGQELQ